MIAEPNTSCAVTGRDPVPAQDRRQSSTPPGDRTLRQIAAIDAWNAARRMRETVLAAACTSRLGDGAASRHSAVLSRTQEVIAARVARDLEQQGGPLLVTATTAVIAHEHTWFVRRVGRLLESRGVTVLECTDNGADALGAVIVEQPDLLFAGDRLVMLPSDALLSEVRLFAPCTRRAVRTAGAQRTHAQRADVHAVVVRPQTPSDVADALSALLGAQR